uniref:Uncharacterized protein n=1 Tax=viral metagenome TaxID=1070528 RepID=A0A6C0KBF9_9ZZZZ
MSTYDRWDRACQKKKFPGMLFFETYHKPVAPDPHRLIRYERNKIAPSTVGFQAERIREQCPDPQTLRRAACDELLKNDDHNVARINVRLLVELIGAKQATEAIANLGTSVDIYTASAGLCSALVRQAEFLSIVGSAGIGEQTDCLLALPESAIQQLMSGAPDNAFWEIYTRSIAAMPAVALKFKAMDVTDRLDRLKKLFHDVKPNAIS